MIYKGNSFQRENAGPVGPAFSMRFRRVLKVPEKHYDSQKESLKKGRTSYGCLQYHASLRKAIPPVGISLRTSPKNGGSTVGIISEMSR